MRLCATITCLICFCVFDVAAQPILGGRTLPAPYDQFRMIPCDTVAVGVGSPGVDVVWSYRDLRALTPDPVVTIYSDSTLLTDAQRQVFQGSDVVVLDDTTLSVYQTVNDVVRLIGRVTPTTELVAESDPYDVRPTEITFDGRNRDRFAGTLRLLLEIPQLQPVTGSHEYHYDGFGTLVLPDFIYDNVARVSARDTIIGEVTYNAQRARLSWSRWTTTWQNVSSQRPLLVIEENTVLLTDSRGTPLAEPFVHKTVRYQPFDNTSSVGDDEESRLHVAPSPSLNDHVTVLGLHGDPAHVMVISARGEVVHCTITQGADGMVLDVHGLAHGTYYVLSMSAGRLRTASFVRAE